MADMKPEEVANLANLYANLNEQLKQLEQNMQALELAGKKKSAEYLQEEVKFREANIAAIEAELKLKENLAGFQEKKRQEIDLADKEIEKIKLRKDTLEAEAQDLLRQSRNTSLTREQRAIAAAKEKEKLNEVKQTQDQLNEAERIRNENSQKSADLVNKILALDEIAKKNDLEKLKAINDLKKATDSLTASMTQSLQTAAGVNTQFSGLISTMANSTGIMGGMGALLKSTGESFRALFNPVNMLSTIITFAISNFQRFYETIFRVTRELGTTVSSGFNAAAAAGSRMGISMEAQAATANSLATSFVNLGNKQREQTTELLVASYEMQRFGIGASESITILSGFQRSLGLSSEQSAELATSLVHTARGLGLTSDAVKGLANNMEQFIGYGSRANEVMKETLEVSSRFGIGTDAIAKMSSKLDSLDASITAANTAARELGVAISPLELLRANPAEKMEILANAIKRSGFEGENARFAIKNLSDAFGLSAAQIQQLTKQAENANNEISGIEKSFRDLDGTLQNFFDGQAIDGLVQFKTLLESAAKPVMALLGAFNYVFGLIFGLVNMGLEKLNKLGTFFGVGLGDALALAGVAILVFSLKIGTALMGLAAKASAALGTMGTGFASMITSMGAAAQASTAAIGPLLAFGFAILMIGAGIGAAAWGMSKFVEAFKGFSGEQIMAIGFAILMLGVAIAGTIAVLGMLNNPIGWAGIAFLYAFAGALFLMSISLKSITDSFKTFNDSMGNNTVLSDFASALKEIANIDIQSPIIKIKAVYETLAGSGDLTITKEKIAAMGDITQNLQVYSQAVKTFQEAGGPTAAQVMTEKFVESMTTISEKITTTQTSTSGGGGGDSARILTIVVEDAEIFKGYIKEVIDNKESRKQTSPGG